jgi:hypothetical protein
MCEKHGTDGGATDENMERAQFTPGTSGYKHSFRICNISFFFTTTMVTQMGFNVTDKCILFRLMWNAFYPGHFIYVDAKGQ